ncbi:MAG: hypothetical protein J6E48_04650 [Prevotella sp.]|nr:hypothetical protein [Prevotella sp.]
MKTRVKLSFNFILTLAAMLTMAQTAMAATEEVTETWPMNGVLTISGSTLTNGNGYTMVLNNDMVWNNNNNRTSIKTSSSKLVTNSYNTEISFPNITGKVTKVELKTFAFAQTGLCLYAGTSMSNLLEKSNGGTAYQSWESESTYSGDVTYVGNMNVSSGAPLKIMFRQANGQTAPDLQFFKFYESNSYIAVTYEKEIAVDPQHTFSFPNPSTFSGSTLTVTCTNNGAGHECNLTNRQASLTLTANDCTIEQAPSSQPSLNLFEFKEQTGLSATAEAITFTNKTTNETTSKIPYIAGIYTASVNVTVDGRNYTLTKDFNIVEGHKVNYSYSQFSVSPTSAMEGEAVTITYTQQMDENLEGLTLKGATSGDNIAYTKSGNTYTFNMPAEDVNLSATFTYPLNENNITQSGDTYTIKTAEGWNYFCRRLEVDADLNGFSGKTVVLGDDISVTTMAGSGKYPFKGTFDGDGNTLTFNHTASAPYCAPFQNTDGATIQNTDGATIRNLHVTGLIEGGNWNCMGGLVGSANGKLTIENCRVSTQISSTFDSNTLSANVGIGGFVGLLSSQYNQCHITGCVFDGLIYNPNYSGTTYGCGGFVGCFSQYGYAILEDCLFIEGQYDNNGGKHELLWGQDNKKNSTFLHRSNDYCGGTLTNCFYVSTRGLKQGSPAVKSATAPANFAHFGTPTDHRFLKVYGHTMVFDDKYYTPPYGDLVETYDFSGVKSYNIEYDDAPLGIPDIASPLWTESLRYNRSFTAGKPVTIMLPFNFTRNRITLAGSNANPSGKFYEFKGIRLDVNVTNKWVAVMIEAGETLSNEVVESTLKANTPYLYVPAEDTKHLAMYVSGGINIFTEGNEGGEKQTEYDGSDGTYSWNKWNFKGTYQPRYWSDSENPEEIGKVYGFAGVEKWVDGKLVEAGEFVRAKVGAKIRPTSCYLMWAGSEPSNARALTRGAAATEEELPQSITVKLVGANGETTAIGTLDTKTGEVSFDSEAWYTLDGIRLSGKPSTKGIYINNGKKIVIK